MSRVEDPVARGLAQGASAHGLGTAAMANEPSAFAFAAIAMALTATFSTALVSLAPVRAALIRVAMGAAGAAF
jgi:putative effector of murein hydrolase